MPHCLPGLGLDPLVPDWGLDLGLNGVLDLFLCTAATFSLDLTFYCLSKYKEIIGCLGGLSFINKVFPNLSVVVMDEKQKFNDLFLVGEPPFLS